MSYCKVSQRIQGSLLKIKKKHFQKDAATETLNLIERYIFELYKHVSVFIDE